MSCELASTLPQSFPFALGVVAPQPELTDYSIEAGLTTYLLNHSLVSCVVGDRIYPDFIDRYDAVTFPAVAYNITHDPTDSITGQSGSLIATVDLDCWANNKTDSIRAAEACRIALQGFRGWLGNVPANGVWFHGFDDEIEQPADNSSVYWFCRTASFNICYSVPLHTF